MEKRKPNLPKMIPVSTAISRYGKDLIGKVVITEAEGDWPGGPAVVHQVGCKDDDNIVMFVRGPQRGSDGLLQNPMGIFHYENIAVTDVDPSKTESLAKYAVKKKKKK